MIFVDWIAEVLLQFPVPEDHAWRDGLQNLRRLALAAPDKFPAIEAGTDLNGVFKGLRFGRDWMLEKGYHDHSPWYRRFTALIEVLNQEEHLGRVWQPRRRGQRAHPFGHCR